MAKEQEPERKVAKRVVKKTIVKRPVANKPAPTVRYGRPSTPKGLRPAAKAAPARKTVAAPRPSRDFGKKAGAAGKVVGQQGAKAASVVGGGVRGASIKVGSATKSCYDKVRAYRLPHLEQTRASAIVGLLIGLLTVGVTVLFAMMFSALRGTSTGGGRWGSLSVVVVAFTAFAAGEYLLARLHVRQPLVTSGLGVSLTLIAIMAFFLQPVQQGWAWLVVPVLGAATFAIAHRAISAADSSRTQPD